GLQVLAAGVGGSGAAGMGDGGDWAACRAMAVGPLLIWWVALSASWRSRRVVHRRSIRGWLAPVADPQDIDDMVCDVIAALVAGCRHRQPGRSHEHGRRPGRTDRR